jgi:predicted CXXCH cytochrome family protein
MKNKSLILVLFVVLCSFNLSGQISGTAHDFSTKTWAPLEDKKCGVCHTVHKAMSVPSAPLWNHQVTSVASYTLYSSPTFDGSSTITNPGASSKLCLSCHDGTVALENFGGINTGTTYIASEFLVGGTTGNSLATEHPISFDYTDALATLDGGLNPPSTTPSGLGGTIASNLLFDNKMECASCHDVHNRYNVAHLLRIANTNSQLCLTCHKK